MCGHEVSVTKGLHPVPPTQFSSFLTGWWRAAFCSVSAHALVVWVSFTSEPPFLLRFERVCGHVQAVLHLFLLMCRCRTTQRGYFCTDLWVTRSTSGVCSFKRSAFCLFCADDGLIKSGMCFKPSGHVSSSKSRVCFLYLKKKK